MIFLMPTKIEYVRKMFTDIDGFVTYHNIKLFETDDEEKKDEEEDCNQDERVEMDCFR